MLRVVLLAAVLSIANLRTCLTLEALEGSIVFVDTSERDRSFFDETPVNGYLKFVGTRQNLATKIMSNGVEVIVADKKPNLLGPYVTEIPRPGITLSPSVVRNRVAVGTDIQNIKLLSSIQSDPAHFLTYTQLTTFSYLTTLFQGRSTIATTRKEIITNLLTQQEHGWRSKATQLPGITLSSRLIDPYFHIYTYLTTYTYYNTFMDGTRPAVLTSKETISNFVTVPVGGYDSAEASELFSGVSLDTHTYYRTYTLSKTMPNDRVTTTKEVVTQIVVTEAPVLNIQPTSNYASEVVKTYLSTITYLTTITQGYHTMVRKETSIATEVVTESLGSDYDPSPAIESSKTDLYEYGYLPHVATSALLTTSTYYTTKIDGNKKVIVTKTTVFPAIPADELVIEDLGVVEPSTHEQKPSATPQINDGLIELEPGLFGLLKTVYNTATYYLTLLPGTVSTKTLVLSQVHTETIKANNIVPEMTIDSSTPLETNPAMTASLGAVDVFSSTGNPALVEPQTTRPPGSNIILDSDRLSSLKESFLSNQFSSPVPETVPTVTTEHSLEVEPDTEGDDDVIFPDDETPDVPPLLQEILMVIPSPPELQDVPTIATTEDNVVPPVQGIPESATLTVNPSATVSPTSTESTTSTPTPSINTQQNFVLTSTTSTESLNAVSVAETEVSVAPITVSTESLNAAAISPTEVLNTVTVSATTSTTSGTGISGGLASLIGGLGTLGLTALSQGLGGGGGSNFGGLNINLGPVFDAMTGILSNSFIVRRNDSGPVQYVDRNYSPQQVPIREPQFIPVGGMAGKAPPNYLKKPPGPSPNDQGLIPIRRPDDFAENQELILASAMRRKPGPNARPQAETPGSVPARPTIKNSPAPQPARPNQMSPAASLLQMMTAPPPRAVAGPDVHGRNKIPQPNPSTQLVQQSQNVPVVAPLRREPVRGVHSGLLPPPPPVPLQLNLAPPPRAPSPVVVNKPPPGYQARPLRLKPSPSQPAAMQPKPIPSQPASMKPAVVSPHLLQRNPNQPTYSSSGIVLGPNGAPVRIVGVAQGNMPPPGAGGQVVIKPAFTPSRPDISNPTNVARPALRREDPQQNNINSVPSFRPPVFHTIASISGDNKIVLTNIVTPNVVYPSVRPTGTVLPVISPTTMVYSQTTPARNIESGETSGSMEIIGNIFHPGLVPAALDPQENDAVTDSKEESVEYDDSIDHTTPHLKATSNENSSSPKDQADQLPAPTETKFAVDSNQVLGSQPTTQKNVEERIEPTTQQTSTTSSPTLNTTVSTTRPATAPSSQRPQERFRSPTFPPDSPFNPPSSPSIILQPTIRTSSPKPQTRPPVTKDVVDPSRHDKAVIAGVSGQVGVSHSTVTSDCSRACGDLEICQRFKDGSQCVCRPGYSRDSRSGLCKRTFSYQVSMVLERTHNNMLRYHNNLNNTSSAEFRKLASAASKGLQQVLLKSGIADTIAACDLLRIHPVKVNAGLIADFLIQTDEDYDESEILRKLKTEISGSNFNLGTSQIYAARYTDNLRIQDMDECSSPEHNKCSRFAHCINEKGSYRCQCKIGYVDSSNGAGTTCFAELLECEECNRNGRCLYDSDYNEIECMCHEWFTGDQCQTNLKVLMIAVVTSIILIFIMIVGFVSVCFLRHRRAKGAISTATFLSEPSGITLDRAAIIRGDTSSESSDGGTISPRRGTSHLTEAYHPHSGGGIRIPRAKHPQTPAVSQRERNRERGSVRYADDTQRHLEETMERKKLAQSTENLSRASTTSHFRTIRNGSDVHSYEETTVRPIVRRQTKFYSSDEGESSNFEEL